jgi:hypothetical protein
VAKGFGRRDKIYQSGAYTTQTGFVGINLSGRKCFCGMAFPIMTGTTTSIESDLNVRVNTRERT